MKEQSSPDLPPEGRQWYDVQFERAQLSDADSPWLAQLRNGAVDEAWLASANRVVAVGSINLREDTDPETKSSVWRARQEFYEVLLGWDDTGHPLHATYDELRASHLVAMPLATVIAAQRVIAATGADVRKVLRGQPSVLMLGAPTLASKVAILERESIDVKTAIEARPKIITHAAETLEARVNLLRTAGLDATRVVNLFPGVLDRATESIEARLSFLRQKGIDVIKVINEYPKALAPSEEAISGLLGALESLDLSGAACINAAPRLLASRAVTVERRIAFFEERGINGKKVLHHQPKSLLSSEKRMVRSLAALEQLGADPVKAVNRKSGLINLAPETLPHRVENLLRLGFERTTIAKFPGLLTYNADTLKQKVAGLRTLGLDAPLIIARFPIALTLDTQTIAGKIELLEAHGIDAVRSMATNTTILGLAHDSLTKKIRLIERYIHVLGWRSGSLADLINASPTLLNYSTQKLNVHARFFARFGRTAMSNGEAGQLVMQPVASHIVWARDAGPGRRDYSNANVQHAGKHLKPAERQQAADEYVADPAVAKFLGEQILTAYARYRARQRSAEL